MKNKLLLISTVAIFIGLAACNKEEVQNPESIPDNAVRITASVGNPFVTTRSNPLGDAAAQAVFNVGDRIRVYPVSRDSAVVYKFNGTSWAPTGPYYNTTLIRHVLWSQPTMSFVARYPIDNNDFRQQTLFSVHRDQSTLENIAQSDLMDSRIENASKGDVLNFAMERRTARIIIKIAGFNPEFSHDSKVKEVRVIDQSDTTYSDPSPYIYDTYITYEQGDGGKGSSYTLLLDSTNKTGIYVSLKVNNKQMRSPYFPRVLSAGMSYTLNLVVGKEKLEIESVKVEDWTNTVIIPSGQAGEVD